MAKFQFPLIRREEVAEGTMAFYFDARGSGFAFTPGQWVRLTLENPPETDAEGNSRMFSIASEPGSPELMIVTRMRDTAFKRVLKTIPLGTLMNIQGPSGRLTLPEDPSIPVVFLTGGIGLTPFLSMIRQAAQTKSSRRITMFVSNRRPEDAPFLFELQVLAKQNSHFTFVPTMTQMEKSAQPWKGERGYITEEMLRKYVPDISVPIFYVAGPPEMVETLAAMLRHAEINEDYIRVEEFTGY